MRRLTAMSLAALSVMAIATQGAAGETGVLVAETSWEKPVPYTKALLEPDEYNGDGGGVYPFCKIAGGSKRWSYIFGLAHYALNQEVNYCGNGLVTHVAWARTWPDTYGVCGTTWGPVTWHVGGGAGWLSVDYHSRSENVCVAGPFTSYGTAWITRRYQGDGYHYTLGTG
jgi:hypothetical protein